MGKFLILSGTVWFVLKFAEEMAIFLDHCWMNAQWWASYMVGVDFLNSIIVSENHSVRQLEVHR